MAFNYEGLNSQIAARREMAMALMQQQEDERRRQQEQQQQMQTQAAPQTGQNNPLGGMDLSSMMNMFGQGGGGAAAVGGGASSAGGAAPGFGLGQPLVSGGVGSASYAPSVGGAAGGAGGASGGAGGLSAAGPWAALAAAVFMNEKYQRKHDNRDTGSKGMFDLLSGNKIVERDADTWGEKIDSGNKLGLKGDYQLAGDITSFDFSNAFKGLKNTVGGKLLRGLF